LAARFLACGEKIVRALDEALHSPEDERAPIEAHIKALSEGFQESIELVRLTGSSVASELAENFSTKLSSLIVIYNSAEPNTTELELFRVAREELVNARMAFVSKLGSTSD
jgi:hypothetical protein